MAVGRKGEGVVDANAVASPSSSSGGRRKRPLSAASPSSSAGGGKGSGSSGQKKKRSLGSASRFIDDAAVDADESEEFDAGGDGDSGEEEDREFMNDIMAPSKDTKAAGKSNVPFFLKEEELSGDELVEAVNARYGYGSDHVFYDDDDKEYDDRKSLLESTADPTIWRVKCMVGQERHLVFCLIQKYVALHNLGSDLPIISAFSLEHIKGYLYIEADKQHDIAEACKGFCTVYTSKIGLVPTYEVPRLLSIQNKTSEIAEGTWVRMKSGKYKGDLAQIVAVDQVRRRATVKLVPRIDLRALAKKFGGGISLKHSGIPPSRLISSRELEDFRPQIEIRHDRETGEIFQILDGLMLKDGYLYKKVSISSLNCFGAEPSSTELVKFEPAKQDEPQVAEYIAHLCGGDKRNNLETLDNSLEDKGNAFKPHDLVFFGRKDFGVIIAAKCDSFQILKGNVEGRVVVNVERKEIKSSCVDKLFTALDSHSKTICINDIVKVLEGPLKDRQGIVRHMYKGTLFIHEEENLENNSFFCAKSELCEVMKENCRQNLGHKSCNIGSKEPVESSSMPQSPTRCSQQRDYDSGFKRCRQGDRDQPFTVGQTLRIRVGPLKGYLCRVVRIYRSDVTVKLDSLAKLITVNCNNLSDRNIKSFGSTRDDTMSIPDPFESQERPFKGELDNENTGVVPSKSSWDFGPPSSTRDAWQGLSTWGGSSASCDDSKTDKGPGDDDPWGNKVTSGDPQTRHSDDAGSQPATIDAWSNWAKAEKPTEGGSESWTANAPIEGEKDEGRGDDSWGSKVTTGSQALHSNNVVSQPENTGWSNWSMAKKSTGDEHESWKGNTANEGEKGSWRKADSWHGGAGASADSHGKGNWGGNTDRSGDSEAGLGFGSNRGRATTNGWSNLEEEGKSAEAEHESWKENATNGCETGGWNKTTSSNCDRAENWNKGSGAGRDSDCKGVWGGLNEKPSHVESGQGFGSNWAKETGDGRSNQNKTPKSAEHESWKGNSTSEGGKHSWTKTMSSNHDQANYSAGHTETPGCSQVGQGFGSSWEKATTWSNWNKSEKSTEGKHESWKGNSVNEGETGGWDKAKSFPNDQVGRWNDKVGASGKSDDKVEWESHSDRSERFERGQGFGRGRGDRGCSGDQKQGGGWGKRDFGGDSGCSWGGGRGRNSEADGSGGKQEYGNRSRGSYGGRGRGRGFDGSVRGRNQEDNWRRSEYSDGRFASGRGRGRRGRGSWEAGGGRDGNNGSFHSGCGSNIKDHSSGWRNDRSSADHGGFSGNAFSSQNSDQTSGWGRSTAFGKIGSHDKMDQNDGWGEKGSFVGGGSGWNKGGEDHGVVKNEGGSWERKEKHNMKQGCSWNSGWGGDKLGVKGSDEHIAGEHPARWQKGEATSKQDSPDVQSNRNLAPVLTANAGDQGWFKPNCSGADQSGGDTSISAAHQSSGWGTQSVNEKRGEDGSSGGSWDRILQSSRKEESTRNYEKINHNLTKDGGNLHSVQDCSAERGANSNAATGDNWEKGSTFPDKKDNESGNWHRAKAFGNTGSSDWGRKADRDETGKDAVSDGDGGKPRPSGPKPSGCGSKWSGQEFGGGNWNGSKPSSGGKQASGWNNDEGINSSAGRDSSGWNNRPAGDAARRNDDCSADFSKGKSYSGNPSSELKGNVAFGRGSGGKGFNQEQPPSGWNQPRGFNHNIATGWKSASTSTKESTVSEDQAWNQNQRIDRADPPGGWGDRGGSSNQGGWERSKEGSAGKGGW
uniref:Putative transcription elongation factor SPT5 1 n=1 Tax=Anthurium amnicola TaxID=1678845 RepID=A0A1D1Y2K9_9ARAE